MVTKTVIVRGGGLVGLAAAVCVALLPTNAAGVATPTSERVPLSRAVTEAKGLLSPSTPRLAAYGPSSLLLWAPGGEALARLDGGGGLDPSFGAGGVVGMQVTDAAVDPRGRILVATSSPSPTNPSDEDARVARLLPDGSLDPSFGDGGFAYVDFGGYYDGASAVAVTAAGDVLVGGRRQTLPENRGLSNGRPAIAQLSPDGRLDRSFGHKGVRVLDGGWEGGVLNILPTRSRGIVIEGEGYIGISIWRLTTSGSPVHRFGENGYVELSNRGPRADGSWKEELLWGDEIAVLPDGRILATATGQHEVGHYGRFRVATVRLDGRGRPDRSFGSHGWVFGSIGRGDTFARAVTVLPHGVTVIDAEVRVPGGARHLGFIALDRGGRPYRLFSDRAKLVIGMSRRDYLESLTRQGQRIVVLAQDQQRKLWLVGLPRLG